MLADPALIAQVGCIAPKEIFDGGRADASIGTELYFKAGQ
jgi:hypothetical protein